MGLADGKGVVRRHRNTVGKIRKIPFKKFVPYLATHRPTTSLEKGKGHGNRWKIVFSSCALSLCLSPYLSLVASFALWGSASFPFSEWKAVLKAGKSVLRAASQSVIQRRLQFAAQKRLQLDGKDVCFATVELDRSVGGKS